MNIFKYPIGTKLISIPSYSGTIVNLDFSNNRYVVKWNDHPDSWSHSLDYIEDVDNFQIIYPHGYQSPLWKVLNGESLE